MSRDGSATLEFGGERRRFKLGIGQHRDIQEALDMGVSLVVERLYPYITALRAGLTVDQLLGARMLGDVRREWARELIFNGLIGGGMTPDDAGKLVKSYVLERPLLEPLPLAYAIGLAALTGPEDEDASGEPAAADPSNLSPEGSSGSAAMASTITADAPDTPPKTLTE